MQGGKDSKRGRVPADDASKASIGRGAARHDGVTSARPRLRGIRQDAESGSNESYRPIQFHRLAIT